MSSPAPPRRGERPRSSDGLTPVARARARAVTAGDFDGGLTAIIASWFISPVMSGLIGQMAFVLTDHLIIRRTDSTRRAVLALPLLYGLTSGVLVFLILVKSKPTKELHEEGKLEYWLMALISSAVGAVIGLACQLIVVPLVRRKIEDEAGGGASPVGPAKAGGDEKAREERDEGDAGADSRRSSSDSAGGELTLQAVEAKDVAAPMDVEAGGKADAFDPTLFAFQYLIIFVAFWESFAHGANDTANATAAFGAIVNAYNAGFETNPKAESCKKPDTPIWIMAVAGTFVFIGMNAMGGRVIRTVGAKITKINFHTGFCIEFASMLTVIIASVLELPVSSTHCQVGAVVFVGMLRNGPSNVEWPLFSKIAASWILTLPVAGCVAALGTAALRPTTLA